MLTLFYLLTISAFTLINLLCSFLAGFYIPFLFAL